MTSKKLACVRTILQDEACSFAISTCNDKVIQKTGIGVKPIMEMIREDLDSMSGAAVADKVIGKAAALLLVSAGVKAIYGELMSETAQAVLEQHGIQYAYGTLVPYIENRTQDGMCPLEACVQHIDQPELARAAVEKQIAILMQSKK